MHDINRYQFIVGILGGSFGLVLSAINILAGIFYSPSAFSNSLYVLSIVVTISGGLIGLIAGLVRNKVTRFILVIMLFLCSMMYFHVNYQSFPALWFFSLATILSVRAGYFDSDGIVNILILNIIMIWSIYNGAINVNDDMPLLDAIKVVAFICMDFSFLYLIFEGKIRELLKKTTNIEKMLEEKIPLAKFGEHAAGIIHSLKNILTRISIGLYFIQIGDTEKGVKRIQSGLTEVSNRVQDVLEMSRSSFDDQMDTIQLKRFIEGFYLVFFDDQFRKEGLTFALEGEDKFITANKNKLILLLEAVISNAIEALNERKTEEKKFVRVWIVKDGFFIINNGGCITKCGTCKELDCMDCPRFQKIGWTTKPNGTGNGIPHIIRICRDFDWTLKIYNSVEEQSTSFFFRTKDA